MKKKILTIAIIGIIAFLYVSIFSFSTSPLYRNPDYKSDSYVFMMNGLFSKSGMIPYKDFFDHKGPFVFFIEYIGQCIHGGTIGIFLIQVIFMIFSLCGIYKLSRYFYNRKLSLLVILLSLLLLSQYYEGGNLTEEFCLPFLIWSFYFAIGYLLNNEEKIIHRPAYSFFYGMTFMVCALTRITNAFPLCIVVLIGFIVLCSKHQWILIFKNIMLFLFGSMLLLLPFIIYFIRNDALYDMFFGTILYNLQYAGNTADFTGIKDIIVTAATLVPLIGAFAIGVCWIIKKHEKRSIGIMVIVSSVGGCIFQLQGYRLGHYLEVWTPLFIVAMGLVPELLRESKLCKKIIVLTTIVVLFAVSGRLILQYDTIYKCAMGDDINIYRDKCKDIVKEVPQYDRDKIVAYNVYAYFYLVTDIKPSIKYCVWQDWQCSMSSEMTREFRDYLSSGEVKYIITLAVGTSQEDLLKEYYDEISVTEDFRLLKRKNQ